MLVFRKQSSFIILLIIRTETQVTVTKLFIVQRFFTLKGGTLQQKISSCLEELNYFMKQPLPVVASMVVAEKHKGSGECDNIVDCVSNILGM
jgi:hypothetical protein